MWLVVGEAIRVVAGGWLAWPFCCFAAIQVACLSIEQSGTVLLSGAAIWTRQHSLPLEMSSWNDHSGMPIAIALVTITTYKYKCGPTHSSFL